MNSSLELIRQIIWPPAAPLELNDDASRRWWQVTCVLNVLLLTAVFHNRIFWAGNCMLMPFGDDYWPSVVKKWLMHDPSLPVAMAASVIIYYAGNRYKWIRVFMAPAFISFLPLTVWIWDIPFTHRIICTKLHDRHFYHVIRIYLRTRHVVALSLVIYLPFMTWFFLSRRKKVNKNSQVATEG